jgi:hypothetical protein
MKNNIVSKIISQNGVFLISVQNKRMKSYAYIINQEDVPNKDILYFEKKFNFEIIGLNRISSGYDNLHIVKYEDLFNLIGTNGNTNSLKVLLKHNYIPNLVKLIKKNK